MSILAIVGAGLIIYPGILFTMKSLEIITWNKGVCNTTGEAWTVFGERDYYLVQSGAVVRTIYWLDLRHMVTE
jgi:hypothetical protein